MDPKKFFKLLFVVAAILMAFTQINFVYAQQTEALPLVEEIPFEELENADRTFVLIDDTVQDGDPFAIQEMKDGQLIGEESAVFCNDHEAEAWHGIYREVRRADEQTTFVYLASQAGFDNETIQRGLWAITNGIEPPSEVVGIIQQAQDPNTEKVELTVFVPENCTAPEGCQEYVQLPTVTPTPKPLCEEHPEACVTPTPCPEGSLECVPPTQEPPPTAIPSPSVTPVCFPSEKNNWCKEPEDDTSEVGVVDKIPVCIPANLVGVYIATTRDPIDESRWENDVAYRASLTWEKETYVPHMAWYPDTSPGMQINGHGISWWTGGELYGAYRFRVITTSGENTYYLGAMNLNQSEIDWSLRPSPDEDYTYRRDIPVGSAPNADMCPPVAAAQPIQVLETPEPATGGAAEADAPSGVSPLGVVIIIAALGMAAFGFWLYLGRESHA